MREKEREREKEGGRERRKMLQTGIFTRATKERCFRGVFVPCVR